MPDLHKKTGVFSILVCLTALLVFAQSAFFFVHSHGGSIIDSLSTASIKHELLLPVVFLPILYFLLAQVIAYLLWLGWVWFVTVSLGGWLALSPRKIYWLGVSVWFLSLFAIYGLNAYYYPHSYFANLMHLPTIPAWLVIDVLLLLAATITAYGYTIWVKRIHWVGMALLVVVIASSITAWHDKHRSLGNATRHALPNIIMIGLDSVRPDYVGYFGKRAINTPHLDGFLQSATIFTNAYTPLARTFPSWVSMLTAKYPLHSHAHVNLVDPEPILKNETLARRLQALGYFTVYGTDEPRFSIITPEYGFDRVFGPKKGAAEILLTELSDFPLTNLLVNLPMGRVLFPYSYANRSASVTYEPGRFLQMIGASLASRPSAPLFLAVHLCLPHWPFVWASDDHNDTTLTPTLYHNSVQMVDTQLGMVLSLLTTAGLLEHSIVVVVSDHGVTLGMPDDRLISESKFRGDKRKLKIIAKMKRYTAPVFSLDFKRDYTINTSYGQGTDVLSEKQNHIVLAMKGYGVSLPAKAIDYPSSTLDIAPTLLELIGAPPMQNIDGVAASQLKATRPFFIETGDKMAEIETNDIQVDQVLKQAVNAYRIDPKTGLLRLTEVAVRNVNANKQHAVYYGDWLLAHYPAEIKDSFIVDEKAKTASLKPVRYDPFYVLVNLKTGEWTTDMDSSFAKRSPYLSLKQRLERFYGVAS